MKKVDKSPYFMANPSGGGYVLDPRMANAAPSSGIKMPYDQYIMRKQRRDAMRRRAIERMKGGMKGEKEEGLPPAPVPVEGIPSSLAATELDIPRTGVRDFLVNLGVIDPR